MHPSDRGTVHQINYALNAFVRGGEVFKSIALSMELTEAEVQPSWDWIALQCLNVLQIIIFSFISRRVKKLEENREKFGYFLALGFLLPPLVYNYG